MGLDNWHFSPAIDYIVWGFVQEWKNLEDFSDKLLLFMGTRLGISFVSVPHWGSQR